MSTFLSSDPSLETVSDRSFFTCGFPCFRISIMCIHYNRQTSGESDTYFNQTRYYTLDDTDIALTTRQSWDSEQATFCFPLRLVSLLFHLPRNRRVQELGGKEKHFHFQTNAGNAQPAVAEALVGAEALVSE